MLKLNKRAIPLFKKIFKKLKPPPNLELSKWADEKRVLSQGRSSLPGKWRTDTAPYQREIMDSISDPDVTKTVVKSCSQIGKTDIALLNPLGYYMENDPSPIMVMQPTLTMGESFSKERLTPMLEDTPCLKNLVNSSKKSGNTILHKMFPGGYVTIVGSNSPQSLAMRPIRILLADEVDRYPASAGVEGDPLYLAGKRMETFWNAKEVNVSTPTIAGISRIETEFEHSSQGEWNVPCPCCGAYQPLVWSNLIYDKSDLSVIKYVCNSCGTISTEMEWKECFASGKYVHKFPRRKIKGFHLNILASTLPGAAWIKPVEKYLVADAEAKKGNSELLKTWTNTELGETWEEMGEQLAADGIEARAEKYGAEVPNEVIYITCGVDTQNDRFELEIIGWGYEKESWGLGYHRIYGDMKTSQPWDDLDKFLMQIYEKEDGSKLPIICTCIDSGGTYTSEVYKFCKAREHRRIYAIKGMGGPRAYVSAGTRNNRYKALLFVLGVDTGKSLLYERLEVEEPGPNYCHFPKGRGYDSFYYKGLTAEKQIMKYINRRAVLSWVLKDPNFKRNEPLDIRNYGTAAMELSVGSLLKRPANTEKVKSIIQKAKNTARRTRGGIKT